MSKIIDFHAHIYPQKIVEKATESVGNFYGISMGHDGSVETPPEKRRKKALWMPMLSILWRPCRTRWKVSIILSHSRVQSIRES